MCDQVGNIAVVDDLFALAVETFKFVNEK